MKLCLVKFNKYRVCQARRIISTWVSSQHKDLDKTLRTEARIVLFAVSKEKPLHVLSCVEVSIIHNGGQSQVREALLSEAA